MSSEISYTEAELAIYRDLVDNKLEPAAEGWGDVIFAGMSLREGKLAEAELQYLSGMESLKIARERLDEEGKDLIAQLLHNFSQKAEQQQEHPDPDKVLALAVQELEEDILLAEEGYRKARLKQEEFGSEIPAEERYKEVKGWYRSMNLRFAIIATILSILAVAVGASLFFIYAWLIVIPLALWAIAMFLTFISWGLQGESLLASLDSELREFAHRDGWRILPSRSDDKTKTDH